MKARVLQYLPAATWDRVAMGIAFGTMLVAALFGLDGCRTEW